MMFFATKAETKNKREERENNQIFHAMKIEVLGNIFFGISVYQFACQKIFFLLHVLAVTITVPPAKLQALF